MKHLLLLITSFWLLPGATPADLQAAEGYIQLSYEDPLLTIKTQQADIKNILWRISDETGIFVRFPRNLNKQISIEIVDVPLARALKKLLRGMNHAIIYSFPKKKQNARIANVYVFHEGNGSTARNYSKKYRSQQDVTARRIEIYEKRIEALRERLAGINPDSTAGRRYARQIESYQKNLDRLRQNQ